MTYLADKRPLRPSVFMPEKESESSLDADGLRRYARGVLCDRLHRIVWNASADEGPSRENTLRLVHGITYPAWLDHPELAVAWLEEITKKHWAFAREQKERYGVPDSVLEPNGVTLRYSEALGLFRCYVEALKRIPAPRPEAKAADAAAR